MLETTNWKARAVGGNNMIEIARKQSGAHYACEFEVRRDEIDQLIEILERAKGEAN